MEERKLASIRRIGKILPIENRDRIVLAYVDAWSVIVKKDEFKEGDLCVYCEIDSLFPQKPEFEFLQKVNYRIRTMRMGGVLSQGICFPLTILPKGNYHLGDDVTKLLGITKYEKFVEAPLPRRNTSKLPKWIRRHKFLRWLFSGFYLPKKAVKFPSWIKQTDESRIQNLPHLFQVPKMSLIAREKVDGCSATYYLRRKRFKYEFGICSRNLTLSPKDDSHYHDVAKKYDIENVLKKLIKKNSYVVLQGEIIGPKIQGNKYHRTENELYCFNLIFPNGRMKCLEAEKLTQPFNLNWCPLVGEVILMDTVEEVLDFATGPSKLYDTLREGIVFRNYETGLSFKAVSPEFLIKCGE